VLYVHSVGLVKENKLIEIRLLVSEMQYVGRRTSLSQACVFIRCSLSKQNEHLLELAVVILQIARFKVRAHDFSRREF
jgi:hypothetical protein